MIALGAVGGRGAVLAAIGASIARFGKAILLFPLTALRAIGVAMWGLVANPVGLTITAIVAGLAALGLWVKNNASGISTFFSSFSESFMKALGPGAAQTVTSITTALQSVWDWVNKILGPIDATARSGRPGARCRSGGSDDRQRPLGAPRPDHGLGSQLMAVGSAAMQSLWEGMKSVAGKIVEWAGTIAARIAAPFKAIGGVLRGLGGGASQAAPSAPAPLQARALGGPVQSGIPYLVGERGPEIFVPNKSGMIETNGSYRRLAAAAA